MNGRMSIVARGAMHQEYGPCGRWQPKLPLYGSPRYGIAPDVKPLHTGSRWVPRLAYQCRDYLAR